MVQWPNFPGSKHTPKVASDHYWDHPASYRQTTCDLGDHWAGWIQPGADHGGQFHRVFPVNQSSWTFGTTAIKVFGNSSERKLILLEWTTNGVQFPLSFILKDPNKASFDQFLYLYYQQGQLSGCDTMTICRWKKHWKITATLKIVITKENAALKIFQCSFRVIFSIVFVCLDENDLK